MGSVSVRRRVKSLPRFFAYRSGYSPIAPIMDNSLSFNAPPVFFICAPPENQSRFQGLAAHFFTFVKCFLHSYWNYMVNLMALLN